jgi:DNA-binding response OmpR family regulator
MNLPGCHRRTAATVGGGQIVMAGLGPGDAPGPPRRARHETGDMGRILLVDESDGGRRAVAEAIRRLTAHVVDEAGDGLEALARVDAADYDLVLLDVQMPGVDGFEVCRRLRAGGTTPIIMLTARSDDLDVVAGLEAGADDYVAKPVRPRVLEARIKAVLRRVGTESPSRPELRETYGGLTIDRSSMVVTKAGTPLALTPTELRLLLVLSARPGQVFSREQLLSAVWEHDYLGDSRLVDASMQRLRAKIEAVPARPVYLQTVRGFGYRFGPL